MSDQLLILIVVGIVGLGLLLRSRHVTVIYPPNVGLLYKDGRFERELGPGRYVFADPFRRIRIVKVAKSALPVPMGEFSVLSKDQFAFRIALSPILEITDARAFTESQPAAEPLPHLQLMPQVASHSALHALTASAAHDAVSQLTLREIVADAALVTGSVQVSLASAIPGASISRILLTGITLPPETRRMFTEVERSRVEAEAALERARGEQAALRALANAARLIKDNPALANLRFLQTLETAPGAKTFVIGSGALPLGGGVIGDGG